MSTVAEVSALRTHPAIIREVLADLEGSNPHAVGRARGIHAKTVYRWKRRREADPSWPTDDDIELWERLRDERGESRRRDAAQQRDYKKRRYLARGKMQVDSLGTVRRLRALYAIGYTSTQIGPALGVSPARVSHLIAGTQPKVHRNTAAKVAALYDAWSMTVPEDPEVLAPRHIRAHARQRRQSAAKGWAPPLAWDNIDDPNEQPSLTAPLDEDVVDEVAVQRVLSGDASHPTTRAERLEVLRRWRASGRSLASLEQLTGWNVTRYVHLANADDSEQVAS